MEIVNSNKDINSVVPTGSMDQIVEDAAKTLKAMAHPLRLKILCVIDSSEMNVHELVEKVGTSQSNVSQHLSVLREKKILACRKDSNRMLYRIGDQRTLMLIDMMHKVFCSHVTNGNGSL
ncbi:MAG: winged helix-turn-helix transcriptional regulator [Chromatiales bacterium]|nr:winged helix-turn-helix transcriptional regulator [Chromatiales bacterium]